MKIPILHLVDGIHHFEEAENAESIRIIEKKNYQNPLNIKAVLNKFERHIQCEITVETNIVYECDRCLNTYEEPVKITIKRLLNVGNKALESTEDDVVNLTPEVVELDVSDWIVEHLLLEKPMKLVCKPSCKGLCAGCGTDLNIEICQCEEVIIDPRWEKLKALRK